MNEPLLNFGKGPADPAAEKPVGLAQRLVFGRRPRSTLIRILVFVTLVFVLFKWVFFSVRVTGISMEPTLRDGDIKLVNRRAYRSALPRRGDIVSVGELGKPGMLMKRIIALPGETYSMRNGLLNIDGQPVQEPYVVNRAPWQLIPVTLGPDEFLVIGDNRGMDQQLHTFGRTERKYIVGKVVF